MINSSLSLPSRERGLKSNNLRCECRFSESLPSRERGLKLFYSICRRKACIVAPFAGAWIEIGRGGRRKNYV